MATNDNSAKLYKDILDLKEKIANMNDQELAIELKMADFRAKAQKDLASYLGLQKTIKDNDQIIAELQKQHDTTSGKGSRKVKAYLKDQIKLLTAENKLYKLQNSLIDRSVILQNEAKKAIENGVKSAQEWAKKQSGSFKDWLNFYNDADKSFRRLVFNMGMAQDTSKILRNNLAETASYAANLGLNFDDLTKLQAGFSEETGRQVVLQQKSIKAMAEIAKGTTLGVDGASKMTAYFDRLNYSATAVRDMVEETLNASSRVGVNGNKALKIFNQNLERAQRYNFKNGIEGVRNMAIFSEKFKMNMDGVFNAIDKTRTLEGAVESVAQLNVLGGRFAKEDPFRLLFLARNDAEGFAKEIQGMTDGLIQFDKTGKALPILAGNFDRVNAAATALGMSVDDLIKQAQQGNKFKLMDKFLGNMSPENKKLVQSLAESDNNGGFTIGIDDNGSIKRIQDLTAQDLENIKQRQITLAQRAKENQAFDEQLANAMAELKSMFLPFLKGFNTVITKLKDTFINPWTAGIITLVAASGTIMTAATIFKGVGSLLSGGIGKAIGGAGGGGTGAKIGGLGKGIGQGLGGIGGGLLKGLAGGLQAFASPQVILGTAVVTAAVYGLGLALEKAAPGIEAIGSALKNILSGFGDFVSKVLNSITTNFIELGKADIGKGLLLTAAGVAALGASMAVFGATSFIGGLLSLFTPNSVFDKLILLSQHAKDISLVSTSIKELNTDLTSLFSSVGGKTFTFIDNDSLNNIKEFVGYKNDLLSLSESIVNIGNGFKTINYELQNMNVNVLKDLKDSVNDLSSISNKKSLLNDNLEKLTKTLQNGIDFKFDQNKVALAVEISNNIDSNILVNKIYQKIETKILNSKKGSL